MAFQISAETADKLILTPDAANGGYLRWVIGGFGLLGLVVGGGLLWLRSAAGPTR